MSAQTEWQCPNCGKVNRHGVLEKRVCERCGYSEEPPEDDTTAGYE